MGSPKQWGGQKSARTSFVSWKVNFEKSVIPKTSWPAGNGKQWYWAGALMMGILFFVWETCKIIVHITYFSWGLRISGVIMIGGLRGACFLRSCIAFSSPLLFYFWLWRTCHFPSLLFYFGTVRPALHRFLPSLCFVVQYPFCFVFAIPTMNPRDFLFIHIYPLRGFLNSADGEKLIFSLMSRDYIVT